MSDMRNDERPAEHAEAATREAWLSQLEETGEDLGYFEPLGALHSAFFSDDGPTLVVTFETAAAIRSRPDQLPWGLEIARARGWSHLCLIAEGETWYRDQAVYRYFDRLVDDAFFEDFDRVVFYGSGMGGYAACAFSVTAPGATVVAVQPAATLDPEVAGWDPRHQKMRKLDFTDRYGYGPDMVEGAGDVYLIYDPQESVDAMHAALFSRPFVAKLPCPNMGGAIERVLGPAGVIAATVTAAGEGRLDPPTFWRAYRARRTQAPYLRRLLARLDAADRPYLAALLCRYTTRRFDAAPRFQRRLVELEEELRELGKALPPARPVAGDPTPSDPAAGAA